MFYLSPTLFFASCLRFEVTVFVVSKCSCQDLDCSLMLKFGLKWPLPAIFTSGHKYCYCFASCFGFLSEHFLFLGTAFYYDFLTQCWFFLTQIANAVYYNAALTLSILNKFCVTLEVFNLWFQLLQQVRRSGQRVNFKRQVVLYLL